MSCVNDFLFLRSPYGISNLPFTFQSFINNILQGLLYKCCISYLDDIIIYSKSRDEHIRHIDQILTRIQNANITINTKKSEFGKSRISYLGMVFDKNTMQIDKGKLEIINKCVAPKSVRELKSFLGMVGFLRRFIKNYSKITAPLNQLLRKDTIYKWTTVHEESFQKLKTLLMSEPILKLPDFDREFIIITDASTLAIAYILMQKDDDNKMHVIGYGGRNLREQEIRYTITELELLAIRYAIDENKHYLVNNHFTVITDHDCLKYLHTAKLNNPRIYRWSIFLEAYNFDIIYKQGKTNPADYLSRINHNYNNNTNVDTLCTCISPEDIFNDSNHM